MVRNISPSDRYERASRLAHFMPDTRKEGLINVSSRADETIDIIEQYIISQGLQPGDALPTEAQLCADLGVSRSSVREAIRQLQALDIVAVHQGRGTFVSNMSLNPLVKSLVMRASLGTDNFTSLREVVTIREVLDLGLARMIVSAMEGSHHEELHALTDAMVEKAEDGKDFADEDIAFHRGLLDAVGNRLIEQLTSAMWIIHMAVLPDLPAGDPDSMIETARAHKAMLDSAESGDIEGYEKAIQAHYAPLLRTLSALPTDESTS